jgi:hypothetical protein
MDKLKQHIQNNLPELDIDQPKEDLWNALSGEISSSENSDPLKDHIEQYSDEFDLETPGEHSWSKIESAISRHTPVRPISAKKLGWYVAAASLVLFIVVGALLYKNRRSATSNGDSIVKTPSKSELTVPSVLPVDTMKEVAQGPSEAKDDKEQVKHETKKGVQTDRKNYYAVVKRKTPGQQAGNKKLPLIVLETQAEYDNLIAGQVSLIQSTPMYGESAGDFAGFIDDFKRLDKQEKKLRSAIMQKGMEENTLDELGMIYQKKLTVLKMLQREISKTGNISGSETDTIPVFIKL